MVFGLVDPEGGALQVSAFLFPGEKDKNPGFLDVCGPCPHDRFLLTFTASPTLSSYQEGPCWTDVL